MVEKRVFAVHELVDFGVLLGTFLGISGAFWDIRYHIDIGRDSFWIPPHLMIYGGAVLILLSSVFAWWSARKIKSQKIAHQFKLALTLLLASVLLKFIAAPIDDLWHRLYGLDVTVWSPPHLLLIFSGCLIVLSFIYFQRLYLHIAHLDKIKKFTSDELKLELMFGLGLAGLNVLLSEFEYFRTILPSHPSQLWPTLLYIFGFVLLFVFMFTLAKMVIKSKWSATRIAVFYFIYRFAISFVLMSSGRSWPLLPPLVIIPAILYDVMFRPTVGRAVSTAVAFTALFYVVEFAWLKLLGIARYVPQTMAELLLSIVCAAAISLLGYWLGKKMMEHVNN